MAAGFQSRVLLLALVMQETESEGDAKELEHTCRNSVEGPPSLRLTLAAAAS
ncbi:MAG TPA: hypothetical protein VM452_18555 [Caulifigura sp.]|jgi:hypothetical protein|nr:hypothetical protein [Caulifigura sp.]